MTDEEKRAASGEDDVVENLKISDPPSASEDAAEDPELPDALGETDLPNAEGSPR